MKLSISNHFDCDPETLWSVFNSDAFNERLDAQSGVRRDVVATRNEGGIEVTELRCVSKKELPGFMAKALGSKSLEYMQTSRFDPKTNRLEWSVDPTVLSDRVTAKGTTVVTPQGDGCLRQIEGEITVRLPLVGKKIEQKLMEEIGSSYERAAEIAAEMIAEQKA